ncbi:MAG: PaaI family thioesterase [Rhodospirillales bacterium]
MAEFTPKISGYAERVRESFARQGVMGLMGASVPVVEPGFVEIRLPWRQDLTQQHGFFHAGVTSTIADSAGGYAGYTLFPENSSVVTVEFKINLVAPAEGDALIARGRVVRPGRNLTICAGEVFVATDNNETLCAIMQQTLMCLHDRPDQPA